MKVRRKSLVIVLTVAVLMTALHTDVFAVDTQDSSASETELTVEDVTEEANLIVDTSMEEDTQTTSADAELEDSSTENSSDSNSLISESSNEDSEATEEDSQTTEELETSEDTQTTEDSGEEQDVTIQTEDEAATEAEESSQQAEASAFQEEVDQSIAANGMITLSESTEVEETLTFGLPEGMEQATVTINLNGYTLSTETAEILISVEVGVTLTIQGAGTICNSTSQGTVISNEGNVVLSQTDILATGSDSVGVLNQSADNDKGLLILSGTIKAEKYAVGRMRKVASTHLGGTAFFFTLAAISTVSSTDSIEAGTYSVGSDTVVVEESEETISVQSASSSAPLAPSSVSVAKTGDTSAALTWTSGKNADSYQIYRKKSTESDYVSIGTTTETSYTDSAATPGYTYYYKIVSLYQGTSSSDGVTASISMAIQAPANVKATSEDYNTIKLSWNSVTGATQYFVYRSTKSSSGYSKLATVTTNSYSDDTAATGTKFYYKIQAANDNTEAIGTSSDSSVVSAKTKLEAPSSLKVKRKSYNKLKIKWSKVSGATKYCVYRSTNKNSGYQKIATVTGTSYTNKGLTCGTKYYYKVRAVNSTAKSGYSKVKGKKPIPLATSSLKATSKSYTSIKVKWSKASGATKYILYRSTKKNSGYQKIATVTGRSYIDKTVSTGVKYYYKLVSYHGSVKGQKKITSGKAVTSKVKKVTATSKTYKKAKLTWKKTKGATQYYIYRSTKKNSGYVKVGSTKKTSYTDKKLTTGETYYYKIYGVANGSKGKASAVALIKIKPGKVKNLEAAGAGSQKSKLTWTKVNGATSYLIYRSTTKGSGFVKIAEVTGTSYKDSGLKDGTKYYYRVYAYRNKTKSSRVSVSYVNTTGITLSSTYLTLSEGGKQKLKVSFDSAATDKTIKWKSSDSSVAKVTKKGVVKAKGSGSCTITATTKNGKTATCKVTISSLVVVLDPGHGGYDSGAVANGLYEKTLNLKVAQYAKAKLEEYAGVTVYLTRSDDSYIGLEQRTVIAQNYGADLFVSLHFNSGTVAAKGSEVYVSVNSSYNSSSTILASRVLSKLSALGLSNRGVKTRLSSDGVNDYYSVIRNSVARGFPGIIIEHAFVSNASDAAYCGSESNVKAIGDADAEAIAEYYGLSKK